MSSPLTRQSKTVPNKQWMLLAKVEMIARWTAAVKLTSRANFRNTTAETLSLCPRRITFRMRWLAMFPKNNRITGSLSRCRARTSLRARSRRLERRSTACRATSTPAARDIIVTSHRWLSRPPQAAGALTLITLSRNAKCNNRCSNSSSSIMGAPSKVSWLQPRRPRISPWMCLTPSASSRVQRVRPKKQRKIKLTDNNIWY